MSATTLSCPTLSTGTTLSMGTTLSAGTALPSHTAPLLSLPGLYRNLPTFMRPPSRASLSLRALAPLFSLKIDYDFGKENSYIVSRLAFSLETLFHQLFWIWFISILFLAIRIRMFPANESVSGRQMLRLMLSAFTDSFILTYANTLMIGIDGNCDFWSAVMGILITVGYVAAYFIIPAYNNLSKPVPEGTRSRQSFH